MLALGVLLGACSGLRYASPEAIACRYSRDAIEFVQETSYAQSDDIDRLAAQALKEIAAAQTLPDAHELIKRMLKGVGDPHTYFVEPVMWDRMRRGNLVSTGLEVTSDGAYVMRVHAGSSAAQCGIAVGMHVVGVEAGGRKMDDRKLFRRLLEYGFHDDGALEEVKVSLADCATLDKKDCVLRNEVISIRQSAQGLVLAGDIAYLELPSCIGWGDRARSYAQEAHDEIARLQATNGLRGWIVDLRRCRGGNAIPIIVSVAPFIGNGPVGGISTPEYDELYMYRDGVLSLGRKAMIHVDRPCAVVSRVPIAVLVSSETASGGEAAAIGIMSASKVAVIGEPTFGLTSAVTAKVLADGALIQVASGWFMTNRLEPVAGPLLPSITANVDWSRFGGADDPTIRDAVAWIGSVMSVRD